VSLKKKADNKIATEIDAFNSLIELLHFLDNEIGREQKMIANEEWHELAEVAGNIEGALNSLFDFLPEINEIHGELKENVFQSINTMKMQREKNRIAMEKAIMDYGEEIKKIDLGRRVFHAYSNRNTPSVKFVRKDC